VIDPLMVMDYTIARVGDDDRRVMNQAAGDEATEAPVVPAGFDMYGLDPARNEPVEAVK